MNFIGEVFEHFAKEDVFVVDWVDTKTVNDRRDVDSVVAELAVIFKFWSESVYKAFRNSFGQISLLK